MKGRIIPSNVAIVITEADDREVPTDIVVNLFGVLLWMRAAFDPRTRLMNTLPIRTTKLRCQPINVDSC